MEKTIRERFDDAILAQVLHRYGLTREQVQPLDGFESFIYAYQKDGGQYILRIGHSRRRSANLIQGEVDWINFLAAGGAAVAPAILSEAGELVEPVPDGHGDHFLATAFVRAAGAPPDLLAWPPELWERYGKALGRIHALSQTYEQRPPAWRPHWDDEPMLDIERNLPASAGEARVVTRFRELLAYLQALPRDPEEYGMIHFDPHGGNFFVDESGNLTFFDFDDCAYAHYIYDVSLVIFYAMTIKGVTSNFVAHFLPPFLRGYRRQKALPDRWLAEIPHFLKLREIDLYAVIHRSFDVDDLQDPWVARYMDGRKERIERGIPYLDLDFARFGGDRRDR
jgi:Ser/Thr protein kinase RdoA (MazF antagonist)